MKKKSQPEPQPRVRTHALSSGIVTVLPNESMDDLLKIENELNQQYEPKTSAERFLVGQMTSARWKILRFRRLEAKAYSDLTETGDSDSAILGALSKPNNLLEKLERMAAAAERALSKAARELTQLRAQTQKSEKQNKAKAADDWLHAELAKIEAEEKAGLRLDPFSVQNEPDFDPGQWFASPALPDGGPGPSGELDQS